MSRQIEGRVARFPKKGEWVRLTQDYKTRNRRTNRGHISEFENCIGRCEGPVEYGDDPVTGEPIRGPEVDVRWQPSNLRYAYMPDDLEPAGVA